MCRPVHEMVVSARSLTRSLVKNMRASNAAADGYTRRNESRKRLPPNASSCGCWGPPPLCHSVAICAVFDKRKKKKRKRCNDIARTKISRARGHVASQVNPSNSMLIKSLIQASLHDLKQNVRCVCPQDAAKKACVPCHKRRKNQPYVVGRDNEKKIMSLVALQHDPRALAVLRVNRTTSAMHQRGC